MKISLAYWRFGYYHIGFRRKTKREYWNNELLDRRVFVYAIIEDGGRQYKVQEGQVLDVDVRTIPAGVDTLEFDKVLLVGEGSAAKIGTPVVAGAKVLAKIQDNVKGPKVDILHFIRRKGHVTRKGHRQNFIRVQIEKIVG